MLNVGGLAVSVTNVCNLRCRMCGAQHMEHQVERSFMTLATWLRVWELVPHRWVLELNGLGEPTLHPKFGELIRQLTEPHPYGHQMMLKMSTNGMWRWNESETVAILDNYRKIGYVEARPQIIFSIDGGTKETVEWLRTGVDFDRLLWYVRLTLKHNEDLNVGVAYTLTRRNLGEVEHLLDLLPGLNNLYLNLLQVNRPDLLDESLYGSREECQRVIARTRSSCRQRGIVFTSFDPAGETSKVRACSVPYYPWIDHLGNLHPCCVRFDVDLGNVNDVELTQHEAYRRMMEKLRGIIASEGCANCYRTFDSWPWQWHFSTEALRDAFLAQNRT